MYYSKPLPLPYFTQYISSLTGKAPAKLLLSTYLPTLRGKAPTNLPIYHQYEH